MFCEIIIICYLFITFYTFFFCRKYQAIMLIYFTCTIKEMLFFNIFGTTSIVQKYNEVRYTFFKAFNTLETIDW